MCILSRIRRLFCYDNRHRYIISSNNENNDTIYGITKYDLDSPYCNSNDKQFQLYDDIQDILSWNVRELLCYSTPHSRNLIGIYLKQFKTDVIFLQGVFNNTTRQYIIDELSDIYQFYITGDLHKEYILGEDSGLLVLSKFPISFNKFIHFSNMGMPDKLTSKGVMYITINNLNFAVCHMPGYHEDAIEAIKELKDNNPFEQYIVVGSLQHLEAHTLFNKLSNNLIHYTHKNKHIHDYIIPIYDRLDLEVNIKHIDIENITHNYPVFGRFKNSYRYVNNYNYEHRQNMNCNV
jgi:hypothetical protein